MLTRRFARLWHDRDFVLGVLGALLALSVLLVHVPATIYAGNVAEFPLGFASYAPRGLALLVAALVPIVLLLALLPRRARKLAAGALCGVALVMWVYGSFLGDAGVLVDGRQRSSLFETPLGTWELPLLLAAVLAAGALAIRFPKPFVMFVAALNIGLVASTLFELARVPERDASTDHARVLRFSTRGNVLVVLMDSLQSDVFARLAEADEDLAAALDGFTLYRDTLGTAPTTLFSIPAIHSGARYEPGERVDAYYQRAVAEGSFLNRLADAGYEATLVNPMRGTCPERATCLELPRIVGSPAEERPKFVLQLLDFSLFRIVPFALKRHVYNDQHWLLSRLNEYSVFVDNVVHANALLGLMAASAGVDDGVPTAKFLHLMNTHPPFIQGPDCTTMSRDLTLPDPDPQVRCALRAFTALLSRLRQDGVYDASTIALIADHGYGMPSRYQKTEEQWGPWGTLMGAANPVFLLKRPHAHGRLAHSDQPIAIADTMGLLCQAAGVDCVKASGAARAPARNDGAREFLWYRWQDIGWGRADIAPAEIGRYVVTGPLWERTSWRASAPIAWRYLHAKGLGFMPGDDRPELSPFEWSIAQEPGTWTEGRSASVALDLGKTPAADLELVADAYAFLPPQQPWQHVTVLVNNVEVARWRFDADAPEGARRARVPQALLTSPAVTVTFQLPDAVSPASLGLSADPRLLAMGLRRLELLPFDAEAGHARR